MTREELLAAFYVDAGLTDEELRGDLAQEGDVEMWIEQARVRIGPYAEKTADLYWTSGATSVDLPPDCVDVARIDVTSGSLPASDKWALKLRFRSEAAADGAATLYYTGYFDSPGDTLDPRADKAHLACVEYALSRFFRKLAASRSDYKRYATVTGQSGIEADDLRNLADDHERLFDGLVDEISLGAPSTFYGE